MYGTICRPRRRLSQAAFCQAARVRVAIEAGVRQGWDQWLLGERGRENKASFIGMSGFGVSAPAEVIYQQMGITADATVAAVKSLL